VKQDFRALAAAGSLLVAMSVSEAAFAQKQGGTLRMSHFDSPASMSLHEEATAAANRPIMGVFNNLVMYKQDVPQKSHAVHRARPRRQLVVERRGNRADLPAAPGRQMA
jgi:hypothetical protein